MHEMNIEEIDPPIADAVSHLAGVDMNLLVLLDALLAEESVTNAAHRVGLSQPAMSHALRRLRRLFRDEILIREGGRSRLTPRAQALKGPLRDILGRADRLFRPGGFDPRTDTRRVTVAMNPATASIFGGILAHLISVEAPEMSLRLMTTMDLADSLFLHSDVDLMLLSEAYQTNYERERLYEDEWVVIAGRKELNAREWLQSKPHVLYESRHPQPPYEAMRRAGINLRIHTRLTDSSLIPWVVSGNDCVGIHRRSVIESLNDHMQLWSEEFPFDVPPLATDVVWSPWATDGKFRIWLRGLVEKAAKEKLSNLDIRRMNNGHV
ncbi:LysR family transcriptional regulator [Rothia uropygialis]|uniref:LysR family transcriptional regulator n=1 Tax=Kocuria sp. 36 TaxID=1415402 RepID=UPI00101D2FC5|nr:LysR family transcriptional regulator [Kocuria sp. 36]